MGALLVEPLAGADDPPANRYVSRHCYLEFGHCLLTPGDHWGGGLTLQTAKLLLFLGDSSQTSPNLVEQRRGRLDTLVDQPLRRGGAIPQRSDRDQGVDALETGGVQTN